MRPDLGRQLAAGAEATLAPHAGHPDVVFVVADGLSARAVAAHAQPVLAHALPALRADGWQIGPLVIVCQGRAAGGDAVAAAPGAGCVAVLNRAGPGPPAPPRLGAHVTRRPRPPPTQARRNCNSTPNP